MAPPYNPYPYADKNHLKIPDVFPTMHVLVGIIEFDKDYEYVFEIYLRL